MMILFQTYSESGSLIGNVFTWYYLGYALLKTRTSDFRDESARCIYVPRQLLLLVD